MAIKQTKKAFEPTKKTIRHYVKTGGLYCLKCGSDNIEGGPFEADAGIVWQGVGCLNCGASWQDEYNLSGISKFSDNT